MVEARESIPIDAVYTWVDGADPAHRAKRDRYRPMRGGAAATEERWRDNGELRYSLRSLHRHAPWIRRIFIVTDQQVPDWLETAHPQIEIVDHRTIFPDDRYLPTFNSCVIEAFLHRIPGLSSHYLYFNDDLFLGRPVVPGDFLTETGQPILHVGARQLPLLRDWVRGRLDRHARLLAYTRLLLRCSLGRQAPVRILPHIPQLFVKSAVERVSRRFRPALRLGLGQRFRNWRMPPLRVLYVNTLLAADDAVWRVLTPAEWGMVMLGADGKGVRGLFGLVENPPKFFCINDDRPDAAAHPQLAVSLDLCLRRLFPTPSPFERDAAREIRSAIRPLSSPPRGATGFTQLSARPD